MVGYDNPCGGFYATRFLSDEEAERTGEEADVLIGFGKGVGIRELIGRTCEEGLFLSDEMVAQLRIDHERECSPLTGLQQLVRQIATDVGAFD
jgi:hypothetical protein